MLFERSECGQSLLARNVKLTQDSIISGVFLTDGEVFFSQKLSFMPKIDKKNVKTLNCKSHYSGKNKGGGAPSRLGA